MQTLSAFCEVIRSSCHAVRSIVMSAAVCEVSFENELKSAAAYDQGT